jgi:hypothetical protein
VQGNKSNSMILICSGVASPKFFCMSVSLRRIPTLMNLRAAAARIEAKRPFLSPRRFHPRSRRPGHRHRRPQTRLRKSSRSGSGGHLVLWNPLSGTFTPRIVVANLITGAVAAKVTSSRVSLPQVPSSRIRTCSVSCITVGNPNTDLPFTWTQSELSIGSVAQSASQVK